MKPSELIDKQIKDLSDWRGKMYTQIRTLINKTDPEIKEEWKWGTAVWAHNGMVCSVGAFKDHIKINFFQGAALKDSHKLFNAGLDAKKTRAIDLYEKDVVDESTLKDLIREAVNYNVKK